MPAEPEATRTELGLGECTRQGMRFRDENERGEQIDVGRGPECHSEKT